MKKIMLCAKAFGNTYNVCKYVEDNSDTKLMIIGADSTIDTSAYDKIILASGVYGNQAHKNILKWLNNNDKTNAEIVVFLTWIGRGKSAKAAFNEIKKIAEGKGFKVNDNYMSCFGKMKFIRASHPNEEDKNKALSWVNSL